VSAGFSQHFPVLRRMRLNVAGIDHRAARQEKAALEWAMAEVDRLKRLRLALAGSGAPRPGT
jgi:hypothetical protein